VFVTELVGWIGSICFATCGAPQAIACIKQGHARGLSFTFLVLWFMGEVCYIAATVAAFGIVPWLLFNYLLNILWILIMLYYRCFKC